MRNGMLDGLPSKKSGKVYNPGQKGEPPEPRITVLYSLSDKYYRKRFYNNIKFLNENSNININQYSVEYFTERARRSIQDSHIIYPLVTTNFRGARNYSDQIGPMLSEIHESNQALVMPIVVTREGLDDRLASMNYFPPQGHIFGRRYREGGIRYLYRMFRILTFRAIDYIIETIYRPQAPAAIFEPTKHIFLSYSSRDFKIAGPLRLELERRGVHTWMDKHDLFIGQDWAPNIDQALRESWAVLLVYTPSSNRSKYVHYEWAYGRGGGACLLPIMVKKIKHHLLHPRLKQLQILDWSATDPPDYPYEKLVRNIIELEGASKSNGC